MSQGYDRIYGEFDSPDMRRVRAEAYDEDIGQHSWVTANELRRDVGRLGLQSKHHLLDLGCGPCGPLTFVVRSIECRATGVDVSGDAVVLGQRRAASLDVDHLATIRHADLDDRLAFDDGSFDAAMSLDVVLHLGDRRALFREVARVLKPRSKLLFTDAGVLAGTISNAEAAARGTHGPTYFVAPGFNERALDEAGFRLLETEDRTNGVAEIAAGRLRARLAQREAFERSEGSAPFADHVRYLETVVALSQRRALTRIMYLAESHGR